MLVLGISAAILGVRTAATGIVFAGLTTAYFVMTGLATVRPESRGTGRESLVGAESRTRGERQMFVWGELQQVRDEAPKGEDG